MINPLKIIIKLGDLQSSCCNKTPQEEQEEQNEKAPKKAKNKKDVIKKNEEAV